MTWVPADDALLAGYGTGDPQAAAAFIRRHQARVYGLALSIVVDPALAEDVAQEAFTRAWRHAATYDARRGSVPTWLLTITRNLAIDALRLRRSVPIDPTAFAALNLQATGMESDPGHAAEVSDHATRMRVALADLPGPQRRALVLAGLCGRTAKEVSEYEGIPLGTAKTRIRTGMRRLRLVLADEDHDDRDDRDDHRDRDPDHELGHTPASAAIDEAEVVAYEQRAEPAQHADVDPAEPVAKRGTAS